MYFDCNPLSAYENEARLRICSPLAALGRRSFGRYPNLSFGQSSQPLITSIRPEGTNVVVSQACRPASSA